MKITLNRRTVIVLLLLAAGAACHGWRIFIDNAEPGSQTPSAHAEKINFRLKWLIYSSFAHYFIAEDKGIFAKEGVDPDIRPGGAGIDPIKLVASGEDDVGLASYGQILIACEKGLPVVAIGQENVSSGVVFVTLKSRGIATPEQFIGKRVGIIPGSDTGTVYAALMASLRLDRSKVDEAPISFSVDPLLNGAIDVTTAAFSTNQPIVIESKGYPVNIIDPKKYGVAVGGNVFFTRRDLLQSNPVLLKQFLRVSLKCIVEAEGMPDGEVVNTFLKYNCLLNKKTEIHVYEAIKRDFLPKTQIYIGVMPDDTWTQTRDIFSESGLVSKDLSQSKCYTNELVNNILK